MKLRIVAAVVLVAGTGAWAQMAKKPCDDLKAEIAKKLDAKAVMNYTLTIVDKGKESDGKIVGSCDGGTKSIVYRRGATGTEAKAGQEKKTQ